MVVTKLVKFYLFLFSYLKLTFITNCTCRIEVGISSSNKILEIIPNVRLPNPTRIPGSYLHVTQAANWISIHYKFCLNLNSSKLFFISILVVNIPDNELLCAQHKVFHCQPAWKRPFAWTRLVLAFPSHWWSIFYYFALGFLFNQCGPLPNAFL